MCSILWNPYHGSGNFKELPVCALQGSYCFELTCFIVLIPKPERDHNFDNHPYGLRTQALGVRAGAIPQSGSQREVPLDQREALERYYHPFLNPDSANIITHRPETLNQ